MQLRRVADEATALFNEVACDYIYGLPGTDEAFLEADLRDIAAKIICRSTA
jgi:hypothetical protein